MSADIAFRQRKIPLNKTLVQSFFNRLIEILKLPDVELSVILINDRVMKLINKQFREINATTDILAFPQYEGAPEDIKRQIEHDAQIGLPILIGDLAISIETIWQRNEGDLSSFNKDFLQTAIHGMLHLLGFDHGTDDQQKNMDEKLEETSNFLIEYFHRGAKELVL